MITNRFYGSLFGGMLLACGVLGAAVSGGDLAFVRFFTGVAGGTIVVIALLSLPFVRAINGWRAALLEALAEVVGGRFVATVGGDAHVRVAEGGVVTLVYFHESQEVAGGADDGIPALPWTCVGALRARDGGPRGVEVRLLPGGGREVRWMNRWWDELGRPPPADPVTRPSARAAEGALRALSPDAECRIRYERDHVAFSVPGHVKELGPLTALVRACRPHVGDL
ncbi:MAG: hypothetical protein ACK4YP_00835 [Myxococcota bacterium]